MNLKPKLVVPGTILTYSGQYFSYANPNPDTVNIEDIAHSLSQICRYVGQCNHFYSVAEHSYFVSTIVPPEYALWGLLHDAAEAYIGDVAKPLKEMLPDYQIIEKRVEDCINFALGLKGHMPDIVKLADIYMLLCEQGQIMPAHYDSWLTPTLEADLHNLFKKPVEIHGWKPKMAENRFLARYEELTNLTVEEH